MANAGFHEEPYDAGTVTKLKIFEFYAQEWIPVFVSRLEPHFSEVHVFDLFCGPGTDSIGVPGSPLRILNQLRSYQQLGKAGWSKVKIVAHLSDEDAEKIAKLADTLKAPEWRIPGVAIDLKAIKFKEALEWHKAVLNNPRAAKLLIIDQFPSTNFAQRSFRYSLPISKRLFAPVRCVRS